MVIKYIKIYLFSNITFGCNRHFWRNQIHTHTHTLTHTPAGFYSMVFSGFFSIILAFHGGQKEIYNQKKGKKNMKIFNDDYLDAISNLYNFMLKCILDISEH